MNQLISVVVPVAPDEMMMGCCAAELIRLGDEFELVMVAAGERPPELPERIQWVRCAAGGRASFLNCGAQRASCDWLWFVHADTRLSSEAGPLLLTSIASHPDSLLYFNLDYYDGGLLLSVSAWGAKWRSKLFGAPFGDQAFCVSKKLHEQVGGYSEDAPYGEDHLYARAVRRAGKKLVALPAKIGTSGRNHLDNGWLNVVARYQWLWIKQAWQDGRTAG